jgi:hypothetical protein
MSEPRTSAVRSLLGWSLPARVAVFFLSASSIWCLLAEFYGICSMRRFTAAVLVPATLLLVAWAVWDRTGRQRQLWRWCVIGGLAGLLAACAYDLFRLPFVFAEQWHLAPVVPAMNLFKVFPRFGAMILGQPIEQPSYSLAAHLVGWAYHFSNGITFGIMYTAMVGDPGRRNWGWAVLLAVGLELAMLLTPYPRFFGIGVSPRFVAVTLTAHLVFGVTLGLLARRWARRWIFRPAI